MTYTTRGSGTVAIPTPVKGGASSSSTPGKGGPFNVLSAGSHRAMSSNERAHVQAGARAVSTADALAHTALTDPNSNKTLKYTAFFASRELHVHVPRVCVCVFGKFYVVKKS